MSLLMSTERDNGPTFSTGRIAVVALHSSGVLRRVAFSVRINVSYALHAESVPRRVLVLRVSRPETYGATGGPFVEIGPSST